MSSFVMCWCAVKKLLTHSLTVCVECDACRNASCPKWTANHLRHHLRRLLVKCQCTLLLQWPNRCAQLLHACRWHPDVCLHFRLDIAVDLRLRLLSQIFSNRHSDQGWVSAGRNLFLPDMRFTPVLTGKNLEAGIVPVRIVQNVALTQYTVPWCISTIL